MAFPDCLPFAFRALACVLYASLAATDIASADEKAVGQAFVVGVSNYRNLPKLPVAANDARLIADTLAGLGFDVTVGSAATRSDLLAEIARFEDKVRQIEKPIVVFYYSGHGIQLEGEDYLFAQDAKAAAQADPATGGVGLNTIINTIVPDSSDAAGLFFFDADRVPPRKTKPAGMVPPSQSFGEVLIGFSTSPGEPRAKQKGTNGIFAAILARDLQLPDIGVQDIMHKVRDEVSDATGGLQNPWYNASLANEIYLKPPHRAN